MPKKKKKIIEVEESVGSFPKSVYFTMLELKTFISRSGNTPSAILGDSPLLIVDNLKDLGIRVRLLNPDAE